MEQVNFADKWVQPIHLHKTSNLGLNVDVHTDITLQFPFVNFVLKKTKQVQERSNLLLCAYSTWDHPD